MSSRRCCRRCRASAPSWPMYRISPCRSARCRGSSCCRCRNRPSRDWRAMSRPGLPPASQTGQPDRPRQPKAATGQQTHSATCEAPVSPGQASGRVEAELKVADSHNRRTGPVGSCQRPGCCVRATCHVLRRATDGYATASPSTACGTPPAPRRSREIANSSAGRFIF